MKIKSLLFNVRVPLIWLLVVLVTSVGLVLSSFVNNKNAKPSTQSSAPPVVDCDANMDLLRQKKSAFVKPLLLSDLLVQDRKMSNLKSELSAYLNQKQKANIITGASVYIRKLNSGSWIAINENEMYNPASLMKVAYLITFLKESESNPGLLSKKVYFNEHFTKGNNQNIVDFKLQEKRFYTIRELLEAMIVYSDNDATGLLTQNLNQQRFHKLFEDLGLQKPSTTGEYFINASEYARFFRILYNATYLNPENSELAVQLLLNSTFREGICKNLDPSIPVAHKFGERIINNVAQLHEFGIVYYRNEPYLIGVMGKANSLTPLKEMVSDVSGMVYAYMSKFHSQ